MLTVARGSPLAFIHETTLKMDLVPDAKPDAVTTAGLKERQSQGYTNANSEKNAVISLRYPK